MKTLYLVRHAKSSWEYPQLKDDERPLLQKGVKRTEKIGKYLKENNITIDRIITSHAVRANDTARILSNAVGFPQDKIEVIAKIYHASEESLLEQLYSLSDEVDSVMLVGHNPVFTEFANLFLETRIDWLVTSGVVCIDFDADSWENILMSTRKTRFMVFPKHLSS